MPESEKSKQAKKEVKETLEKIIGFPLYKKGNSTIFYSQEQDINFIIKFSKQEEPGIKIRGWYEFSSNYPKSEHDKTIIVFLLEGGMSFFVPVSTLLEAIYKNRLQVVSDKKYKLHIDASDKNSVFFEEIPSFNLQQYANQLGLQFVKNMVPTDVGLDNKNIEDLDLLSSQHYIEGNIREVLCNQYERDPQARRKCVEIHGLNCHICGFNFQKFYGDYGENFIHVHHLVPISKIGKDYIVNPEKDLIPLCANCHAIVHRVDPPYTPQQVKEVINLSVENQ
jgi:hypothetical protein